MAPNQTPFNASALKLGRCPHCSVAEPLLQQVTNFELQSSDRRYHYYWKIYGCSRCGKPVVGGCVHGSTTVDMIYPQPETIGASMPPKVASFLRQAVESVHAPSGSIMLCASAVDAMLKERGLKDGNLYPRIEAAVKSGLITPDMGKWAHEVRLDANDERHADVDASIATHDDARKCIEFAKALAEILFVLPARIQRGLEGKIAPEAKV